MAANFEEQRQELLAAQDRTVILEAENEQMRKQLKLLNQAVRELQGRSRGHERIEEETQVSVITNNIYECLEMEEVNMTEQERPLKRIRKEKENIFLKPIKGDDKEAQPAVLAKKAIDKEKNMAENKNNKKEKKKP